MFTSGGPGARLSGGGIDSSDDWSLMAAIAAGDRAALSTLHDRHAPLVLGICRRILRDAGEAEDAATDIFYEIWARSDRFDPSRGSPLTYIVRLSRSRAIDRKRSRDARPKIANDFTDASAQIASTADPSQTIHLGEQRVRVRAALSKLDPAQREAVECSFYEGLSHSEIAAKLNRPLGTVKTYIRQGLIRLRESLRIDQ